MKYFKSFAKVTSKREKTQLLLEYRSSLESIDAELKDLENMTALESRTSSASLEDDSQVELAKKLARLNNNYARSQLLLENRPSKRSRSRWSLRKLSLRRLSGILESCKAGGAVARRAYKAIRRIIRRVKTVARWCAHYGYMWTDFPGFELLLARIYMEVFARLPTGFYWEWGASFDDEFDWDFDGETSSETSSDLSISSCGSWSSFMHRSDSDVRPPPPPSGNLYMNDEFDYQPFDDLVDDYVVDDESFEVPQNKFVRKSVSVTTEMSGK